ncbi:hypothetical protein HYV50_02050 [Candidatus Pacearchaeota archaeon]|nr:hypothetical protein [Candidatus Pacearchaeota archaeon]
MKLKEALNELKKEEKKKFEQSVDLIVNLKGIDLKRDQVNIVVNIPHKIKEKKVCGFFSAKTKLVDSITEPEFAKYKDKKALKNLVRDYDYFISTPGLMAKVATAFGKVLGPVGKMPSPQLGIIGQENENAIKNELGKIEKAIKIRLKEPSIKVLAGRENMKDEEIVQNIESIYNAIINALPKKKENVRNVMIKLTMGKPIRVEI